MANINEAIIGIMSDIGAIGKDSKNQQQGFMYRGIDAVMNALQPALSKHKVYVVPEVMEHTREERTTASGDRLIYSILKIKYTFYAEDGSSVSATVIGEGMDSADKSSNKAMSVAFKYACFQVFCIPTEEMVDPDAETPPNSVPQNEQPQNRNEQPKSQNEVKKIASADKLKVLELIDAYIQGETKKGKSKEGILNAFILGTEYETKKADFTNYAIKTYGVSEFDEITPEQLRDVLYKANIKIGKIV